MAKETFYFSHDYYARSDKELMKVRMNMGMAGIGIYWCIVEMLYEENGYLLRSEYERISFELRTDVRNISSIIEGYKLFKFDDQKFWSDSVLERLDIRNKKSEKARESVNYRWRNTNVIRHEGKRNTIKESKVKETLLSNPDGLERGERVKNDVSKIPLPFENPDFVEKWGEWLQYRKERRLSAYTPTGLKNVFTRLKKISGDNSKIAIEVINQSLAASWMGFFELKHNSDGNTVKNPGNSGKAGSVSKARIQAAKDF